MQCNAARLFGLGVRYWQNTRFAQLLRSNRNAGDVFDDDSVDGETGGGGGI